MKMRVFALVMLVLCCIACTSWHKAATDVNVSGESIVYLKDDRTNLCFAVLFIGNKTSTSLETMGMTSVSCEDLEGVPVK